MSILSHRAKWLPVLFIAFFAYTGIQAGEDAGQSEFRDFDNMTPDATVTFEITSIKLLAGGSWGSGVLKYKGTEFDLKLAAITAGGVGYKTMKGEGEVYDLKQLEDIEGVYRGGGAGANVGDAGGTSGVFENGKGVVIRARSTESSGAQLSLSLGGMEIELEK